MQNYEFIHKNKTIPHDLILKCLSSNRKNHENKSGHNILQKCVLCKAEICDDRVLNNKCDKCYHKRECKLCHKDIPKSFENFAFKCDRCHTDIICESCIESCSGCCGNFCKKCDLINVCLECDKSECRTCCKNAKKKCKTCGSSHHCNKCLKINNDSCVECYSGKFTEEDKIRWECIDQNNPQLPLGIVICTNNIEAGIENGRMTHVWIGKLQKFKLDKSYDQKYRIDCSTKYDYYGSGSVQSIDYWSKVPHGLKFDHTGDKIENLRVFVDASRGYYSVIKL